MSVFSRSVASLVFFSVGIFPLHAQKQKNQNSEAKNSQKDSAKTAAVLTPGAAVPNDDDKTLGDYVPCLMDKKTLYAMRGRVPPADPKIDPNTPITSKAAQLIADQSSTKATDPDFKKQYKKEADDKIFDLATKGALTYKSLADSLTIAATSAADTTSGAKTATDKKAIDKQKEDTVANVVQETAPPQDSQFKRPTDVSCAMSVYSWNVARMIFGRTVANNYLAVQVTVRNLDADHEFLLHDAELAVDATSGQLERFQTSSEKQAVRGVTIYGQSYDRRALWGHGVEGLGFILGAVVGVIDVQNLTSASGAYAAGFQPAFNKLFPDLSTNNLNNLNDLGFSAAAASRIVVPKGGSVPFVIFVPLMPLGAC